MATSVDGAGLVDSDAPTMQSSVVVMVLPWRRLAPARSSERLRFEDAAMKIVDDDLFISARSWMMTTICAIEASTATMRLVPQLASILGARGEIAPCGKHMHRPTSIARGGHREIAKMLSQSTRSCSPTASATTMLIQTLHCR